MKRSGLFECLLFVRFWPPGSGSGSLIRYMSLSGSFHQQPKKLRILISTLDDFLSLKTVVNVPAVSIKTYFLLAS